MMLIALSIVLLGYFIITAPELPPDENVPWWEG